MTSFTTGAGEPLLEPILRALDRTRDVMDDSHPDNLEALEAELAEVLAVLREELSGHEVAVTPTKSALDWSSPESHVLVQVLVALCDYFDVLACCLRNRGIDWGSHLFSAIDFRHIGFKRLSDFEIDPSGLPLLIGGISVDLLDSLLKLQQLWVPSPSVARNIDRRLRHICDQLGSDMQHSAGPTLMELQAACISAADAEFRLGTAEFQARRAAETIFELRSWTGEMVYPDFQFERRAISALCDEILTQTDLDSHSWMACHWLSRNIAEGRDVTWFLTELGDRCRVKASWSAPAVRDYRPSAAAAPTSSVPTDQAYYRITAASHTPFFFAQRPTDVAADGPGGRFDLAPGSPRGSTYLSGDAEGACAEVFGHQPACSLVELLDRRLWTLSPMKDAGEFQDLSALEVHLVTTSVRSESQQVAEAVAARSVGGKPAVNGLITPLRTTGTGVGVVLFGPAKTGLPAASGLGVWKAKSSSLVAAPEVWEYVASRYSNDMFPFLMQRLPSEIEVATP